MKKYIRTKDGRIIGFEPKTKDLDLIKYLSQFINYQGEYAPISQADTIEELCDEFVCDHNNGTRIMQAKECKPQFPFRKDVIDYLKRNNQTFYGAIWADKGLIFVAKMNDKGELELL